MVDRAMVAISATSLKLKIPVNAFRLCQLRIHNCGQTKTSKKIYKLILPFDKIVTYTLKKHLILREELLRLLKIKISSGGIRS